MAIGQQALLVTSNALTRSFSISAMWLHRVHGYESAHDEAKGVEASSETATRFLSKAVWQQFLGLPKKQEPMLMDFLSCQEEPYSP